MKIFFSARIWLLFFFLLRLDLVSFAQVCIPEYATKSYISEGLTTGGFAVRAPNGDYIFGGGPDAGNALLRLDKDGNLLWSKAYNYVNPVMYNDRFSGAVDSTGNLAFSIKAEVMVLGDPNGNVLTMKRLRLNYSNLAIWKVLVLPDNKKLVLAKDYSGYGTDPFLLLCLSPDLSTIIWTKALIAYGLFLPEMAIRNNSVVIVGSQTDFGVMVELNSSTGAFISQHRMKIDGYNTYFKYIYPWQNGYLLVGNNNGTNADNKAFVLRLNPDLSVASSYRFTTIDAEYSPLLAVNNDGSYYGAYGSMAHYRFYITAGDSLIWNRFIGVAGIGALVNYTAAPDGLVSFTSGTYFAVGIGINYRSYIMNKSTYEGIRPGCDWQPTPLPRQAVGVTSFPVLMNIRDTSTVTLVTVAPVVTGFNTDYGPACNIYSTCDALEITGPATICAPDTVLFTGIRNPGCLLPVNWTISGGTVQTTRFSDSTLSVQFTQPGYYTLIASLGISCQYISDTFYVQVSSNGSVMDIGPPDTTLCQGGTMLLNAQAGYTAYVWQDGSTDSTFLVTAPGQYFVTVLSACGQSFSDTIHITAAAPVQFSACPDRTRCNDDTIQLRATSGFMNYNWGPSYFITGASQQVAVVKPAIDTLYYVRAEISAGCFVYDSVRVTVRNSAPINLGPDKSFCLGDSAVFFAGNGFIQYDWSNGTHTPSITVKTAGLYSITATDASGCRSTDSIVVSQVWPLPNPVLYKDSTLCAGEMKMLQPGNFSTYLWQDGSTAPSFPVTGTGVYTVTVTDLNSCKATASSRISTIIPLPSAFLPADTGICSYGRLLLQPYRSFTQYQWSNNVTTSANEISSPGQYWLTVVTREGCAGTDTVNVSLKECAKGLFVPSAFTPNQDGKNDILMPFLFGQVKQFRFAIYNRNGEIVFQTSQLNRGWDGTYKGLLPDSQLFIWSCTYQLEGESTRFQKGTIMMIR